MQIAPPPPPRQLRYIAIALWLLSLALPTLQLQGGGTQAGYQLLGTSGALLPMALLLLPFSALMVASWLSNLLFVFEIWHLCRRTAGPRNTPLALLAALFAVNVLMGFHWAGSSLLPLHSMGLLALPGYYCWLLSFAVLGCARLQETPLAVQWLGGLFRRVGLMVLVAAVTLGLALVVIVLIHRA